MSLAFRSLVFFTVSSDIFAFASKNKAPGSIGSITQRGARWCLRWCPACRWFDLQCLHDESPNVVANPHCQAALMWTQVRDDCWELPNVRKSVQPIWSWVYVWWESVPQVRCLPTSTYTIDNFMHQRATKIIRQEKRHTRNTHEKHGADSKHTETHGNFEHNTNWNNQKTYILSNANLCLRRSMESACFGDAAGALSIVSLCESHLQSDRSTLLTPKKDSGFFLHFPPSSTAVRTLFRARLWQQMCVF